MKHLLAMLLAFLLLCGIATPAFAAEAAMEFTISSALVYHTLADPEDYVGLADIIERMYNNPDEFLRISKSLSEVTRTNYCRKNTVEKEAEIIKENLKNYSKKSEKLHIKINIITKGKYMDAKFFIKKVARKGINALKRIIHK